MFDEDSDILMKPKDPDDEPFIMNDVSMDIDDSR